MAYGDYFHCDKCGAKAFYDANIDWEHQHVAKDEWGAPSSVAALCEACAETHELKVVPKERVEKDGGG